MPASSQRRGPATATAVQTGGKDRVGDRVEVLYKGNRWFKAKISKTCTQPAAEGSAGELITKVIYVWQNRKSGGSLTESYPTIRHETTAANAQANYVYEADQLRAHGRMTTRPALPPAHHAMPVPLRNYSGRSSEKLARTID